jgi:hypothetical protein
MLLLGTATLGIVDDVPAMTSVRAAATIARRAR